MKAHASLARVLTVAGSVTLLGASSLTGCHDRDLLPFTGADFPTGPMISGMPPVVPDAEGILRIRDVPATNSRMTFCIPELGLKSFAVDLDFAWNADIDTLGGFAWIAWGECRGYITDEAGNRECVFRGYYHSRRRKVSDTLWISEADWLGTFCAGPLEGIGVKASEVAESWHPMMATGYSGKLTGVLSIPESFDLPLTRHRGWKARR
jgi:hypothetical protein